MTAEPSARLVTLVAAFSVTLIRLPVYFGHERLLEVFAIGVFVLCIAWAVPRKRRLIAHSTAGIAAIYVAVICVELLRGSSAGVYGSPTSAAIEGFTYICVLAFAVTLIASAGGNAERDTRFVAIALAPAVYMAVNLALHFGGAASPTALDPNSASLALGTPAELLGLLGVHTGRVQFPLANSINNFGVAAAGGLVAAIVLFLRTDVSRRLTVPTIVACGGCLLLGDNRGSLLIAVAVSMWFLVARRVRGASGIAAIVPVLPVVVVGGLGLLANSGVGDLFSRNAGDFTTGNSRVYIWDGVWRFLQEHAGPQLLYGWGAAGQVSSGASDSYAYLFAGRSTASTVHTHDLALQSLLDGGLIALAATTIAVGFALVTLARLPGPALALLAMLIVVLLCGATEVAPTYYSQEALVMTLLVIGAAAGIRRTPRTAPATSPPATRVLSSRRQLDGQLGRR